MEPSDHGLDAPRTERVALTHRQTRFLRAPSAAALDRPIVVGITHRNHPEGLREALASVASQDLADRLTILVLDDSSEADWLSSLGDGWEADDRLVVATARLGSPAHARNALLDLVDDHFPSCRWVARLDADDLLATPQSLRALVEAGDQHGCDYVVGSNRLREGQRLLPQINRADPRTLTDPARLKAFIQAFCSQRSHQELPSCNLLLRARSGIRYPLTASAEDHWLVAGLLMHASERGCVIPEPTYAVYSLNGMATRSSKKVASWVSARKALANAVDTWLVARASGATILGWGQEGVVFRNLEGTFKQFYPHAMSSLDARNIQELARDTHGAIADFDIVPSATAGARIRYKHTATRLMPRRIGVAPIGRYLTKLYRSRVVTANIKRDNLRVTAAGELHYIDIGKDIVPLSASRFLDVAARLYAIGELGWSDHELARRRTEQAPAEALQCLPGFDVFYRDLMVELHPWVVPATAETLPTSGAPVHADVTLLLKACAQDADWLRGQVMHIVGELRQVSLPGPVVLLIDPFEGPYLRQHATGDGARLHFEAERLKREGWLDEVWVAPRDGDAIRATHAAWFGRSDIVESHTTGGAPLFSQVWAFEQVSTRYVLQCDVDVLISLADRNHDVLNDMKRAALDDSVWCVGFNIPQQEPGYRLYQSSPAAFPPEVRFGLLDLGRILERRPFPNTVHNHRFERMWHRVLEAVRPVTGMRSVRGGDSRSRYIHPLNVDKDRAMISRVRDLFSQGLIPAGQHGHWDVNPKAAWSYPHRGEAVVLLLLGRDTPSATLDRCMESIKRQTNQAFGVILIDDGGHTGTSIGLHHKLAWLGDRLTLIRRPKHVGYIANFREAVECICLHGDTMLVVVDQDDALLGEDVIDRIAEAREQGADLLNGPMFRPDKPLQLYPVSYHAPRSSGGGNVWAHLRAFRKSLFEKVPKSAWNEAPDTSILSDFLTMVPMAELARSPRYLDGPYVYLHDRGAYSSERKRVEQAIKRWLFEQSQVTETSLSQKPVVEPPSDARPGDR